MKVNPRRTKFPRNPRHAFDFHSMREMHQAIVSLLRLQVVNGTGTNPQVFFSEGNVTIVLPQGGAGQAYIAGEWDPAAAYPDTSKGKQAIVTFTPDGEAAGTFYNLQPVPAGISPDTGAPYWADLPTSPPGVWA